MGLFIAICLSLGFLSQSHAERSALAGPTDRQGGPGDRDFAHCQETFKKHDCGQVKARLKDADQGKIIDCSRRETYKLGKIVLGCGHGIGQMVWDTAQFAAQNAHYLSPQARVVKALIDGEPPPEIQLAMKVGREWRKQIDDEAGCSKDPAQKRQLIEPVKDFLPSDLGGRIESMSCRQIQLAIGRSLNDLRKKIAAKKVGAQQYEDFVKRNPEQRGTVDKHFPKDRWALDEREKKFTEHEDRLRQAENLSEKALRKLKETHACYTNYEISKMACTVVSGLLTPGGLAKAPRAVHGVIAQLSKAKTADLQALRALEKRGFQIPADVEKRVLNGESLGRFELKPRLSPEELKELPPSDLTRIIGTRNERGIRYFVDDDAFKKEHLRKAGAFADKDEVTFRSSWLRDLEKRPDYSKDLLAHETRHAQVWMDCHRRNKGCESLIRFDAPDTAEQIPSRVGHGIYEPGWRADEASAYRSGERYGSRGTGKPADHAWSNDFVRRQREYLGKALEKIRANVPNTVRYDDYGAPFIQVRTETGQVVHIRFPFWSVSKDYDPVIAEHLIRSRLSQLPRR